MSSLSSQIDLNDSDILTIERVVLKLSEKQSRIVSLEGFRQEIIERFADEGFKVGVNVFEDLSQKGLYAFEIEIQDRLEGEFDPDRQVYEATADILGLGTQGVTNAGGIAKPREAW